MVEEQAFTCPFCGAPYRMLIPAGVVQVKCHYCGSTVLVPPRLGGLVQRCPNHPDVLAIGLCNDCGEGYCGECLYIYSVRDGELYLCPNCLKKRYKQKVQSNLNIGIVTSIISLFFLVISFEAFIGMFMLLSLPFLMMYFYYKKIWVKPPTVKEKLEMTELAEPTKPLPYELAHTLRKDISYEKVLEAYVSTIGGGRQRFEMEIEKMQCRGLTREQAIQKIVEKLRI